MASKKHKVLSLILAFAMMLSLMPVSAMAADGDYTSTVESDGANGVKVIKTATTDAQGNTTIDMEAYVTGTVTSPTYTPLDVVLVLDQSGSMDDSLGELRAAVRGFVQTISDDAKEKQVDHRIAIVGFASTGNSWTNTGLFVNGELKSYGGTTSSSWEYKEIYQLDTGRTYYIQLENGDYKDIRYSDHFSSWYYGRSDNRKYITPKTSANDATPGAVQVYELEWVTTSTDGLTAQDYKDSLVSVNTNGSITTSITQAIGNLNASGDTYSEYGMEMANQVFANNTITDGERHRVVVMFTDGYTAPSGTNDFKYSMANNAISAAHTTKNTYDAEVYTIGMFTGADPDMDINANFKAEDGWEDGWFGGSNNLSDIQERTAANRYMHYVSSNYPDAENLGNGGTMADDSNYYMSTDDKDLSAIFEEIAESTIQASVTVGSTSELRDTVSNYFVFDGVTTGADGVVTSGVTVKKVPATGTGTNPGWGTAADITSSVTVKVVNGTLTVTGFDYSSAANCVVKKNGTWQGNKLVLSFDVKPNTDCEDWTDTANFDTNAGAGLYYGEGNQESTAVPSNPNAPVDTYTVSYSWGVSGIDETVVDSQRYISGQSATVLGTYEEGDALEDDLTGRQYVFKGWQQGSTVVTSVDITDSSVTLTAKLVPLYTVTYYGNTNTSGAVPEDTNSPYEANDPATILGRNTLVKTGYTFGGWNTAANGTGDDYAVGASVTMTEDLELYARWNPIENTKYTVEIYKQNLDGSYPTTASESYEEAGTTDTRVSATAAEITGFTFDADNDNNITSGVVAGDGSLVLKLYYERDAYTITYQITGSYFTNSAYEVIENVKFGAPLTLITDDMEVKDGYLWQGWSGLPATMPAEDVTVTGYYTTDPNTQYTVNHLFENLLDNDYAADPNVPAQTLHGETGTLTAAVAGSYSGFAPKTIVQQTIAADGATVVNVYYDRIRNDVTYQITGSFFADNEYHLMEDVKYGTPLTLITDDMTRSGYVWSEWQGLPTTMPTESVTVTGYYSASTNTAYEVNHYLQNVADDGYTLAAGSPEAKTGTTGEDTAAAPNTYPGFTARDFEQETIAADGSTVVDIYYDRNVYDITYKIVNSGEFNADPYEVIEDVQYGATLSLISDDMTEAGYVWSGWQNLPDTMPHENVVVTGTYSPYEYTAYQVKHHQQNVEGDGYTLASTENKTGTTGEDTAAAPNTYPGFTARDFEQETIAADGSTVVDIYYDRNVYDITYKIVNSGEFNADPYEVIEDVRYGATLGLISDDMTEAGYVWSGWQNLPDTMPHENVVVTGTYSPYEYTAYQVKHHQQNVEGDGYTLASTENKTGTTGEDTVAEAQTYTGFEAQEFTQKKIAANGSTVVDIYYDRVTHDVVYKITGNFFANDNYHTDSGVRFGATLTLIDDNMIKPGYSWSGWTGLPVTMPDDEDVEVTGSYSAKTDTKFTVQYKMQNVDDNDYADGKRYESAGTTGMMTAVVAEEIEGFAAQTITQQEIAANGSTVVYVYYNRNTYDVTYKIVGDYFADDEFQMFENVKFGAEFPAATNNTNRTGYIWSGWDETLPTTMPAEDVVLTGSYAAMNDITYTVKHYQQNLEQTGYEEPEVETLAGTTGELTAAIAKKYPGFTNRPFDQKLIAGNGSTVVEIYYDRNTYEISYDLNGGTGADGVSYATESFIYGENVTVKAAPSKKDHAFIGWHDGTNPAEAGATFAMPAMDIEYIAQWKANKQELNVSKTLATVNGEAFVSGKISVGDVLVYDITVSNTGDVDLNDIKVRDEMTGNAWTVDVKAGKSVTLTTNPYTVKSADAGKKLTNVAVAVTEDGPTDSGSNTVDVEDNTYTVTTSIDHTRYNTITPTTTYNAGDDAKVYFTVGGDYYIDRVTVDGERYRDYEWDRTARAYVITFDDIAANHTVVVETEYDDGGYTPPKEDDKTEIEEPDVPLAGLDDVDHFAYIKGYEDGTVRPDNNITREEVATIFYRLLTDVSREMYFTEVNDFSDVDSSNWSNKAISTLANAGIINGYPDGTFQPKENITRAEFAAIAARFDVVTESAENPFTDIDGHWGEELICFAASKGWVNGYPDDTFRPERDITRAEAMTLINRVLDRAVDEEGLLKNAKQWPDNQKDDWFYYAVLEATNSHDYERRTAGEIMENWTALTADRTWDE